MNISDYDDLLKGKAKVDAAAASTALGAPDVGPPSARDSIYPAAQTPEAPAGGANKKSRLLGMNRNVLGYTLGKGAQAVMGKQYEGSPAAMLGGFGAEMNQSQAYASTARKLLAGEPMENIPEASILAPEQLTVALDTAQRRQESRFSQEVQRAKLVTEYMKTTSDVKTAEAMADEAMSRAGTNRAITRKTEKETNLIPESPEAALKQKKAEAEMLTDEDIRKTKAQGEADISTTIAGLRERYRLNNLPITKDAISLEIPGVYRDIVAHAYGALDPALYMRTAIDTFNAAFSIEPVKWPEEGEDTNVDGTMIPSGKGYLFKLKPKVK